MNVPTFYWRDLPKLFFFIIVVVHPLFCFTVYEATGMEPGYVFGVICFSFLLLRVYQIYRANGILIIPQYIIYFGLFALYAILSNIFVSVELREDGAIKYLYSNPLIHTLTAFLIVENTRFPKKWIKIGFKVLGVTLILAAIVSVIQISNPLFFLKDEYLVQGLSYERIIDYYNNNPRQVTGDIARFLSGYRFSIYSFIGSISVGIDNIAIFSLLIAVNSNKWVKTGLFVIAAALVSFLSSARWVMLNFVIVASQNIWLKNNKLLNVIKYALYGIILVLFFLPVVQFLGIDIQQFIQERFLSDSASTRLLAFEVFVKVFPENPILGTSGADSARMLELLAGQSSQIHVGYLKLLYYYGIIGGLLYLVFLVALLVRMWKTAKYSRYWGSFFAILAFAVANITLVQLDLFYYGLLLAILFSNHFFKEQEAKLSQEKSD